VWQSPGMRDDPPPEGQAATLLGEEQLDGEVLGLIFAAPDTGFGVIELGVDDDDAGGVRCTGPLADLVEGQLVRLAGRFSDHPVHGRTFEATWYEQTTPTTVDGLRTFLLSSRFALEQRTVDRLLARFGSDAGWVIDRDPDRLVREAGWDPDEAREVHERWQEGRAYADLVRLLEPAGVRARLVRAAFAAFHPAAFDAIRSDPYDLVEVEGWRFAQVDAVGRTLEVGALDPRRLAGAARAAHRGARQRDGHLYLTAAQDRVGLWSAHCHA
jgi:exodeoxyribonuclease V alpha subunit